MRVELEVWRQDGPRDRGRFESYTVDDATAEMSLLELLDRLNDALVEEGREPVVFESDCREGVCGMCGFLVNGRPHGPSDNTPACRQHLRAFPGVTRLRLEPLRAGAFPVIRDLVVDRSALDELIRAGGTVDVAPGTAPDADSVLQPRARAGRALDFAACIGCGACVAACPNGAAMLFAGAKLAHLSLVPAASGQRAGRARAMSRVLDEAFGPCSLYGECVPTCPAGIPLEAIARLNREVLRAAVVGARRDD
ncbi:MULTISPECIES: succinate dehydrogenase/fumarate reductase iron-sulfur subunit [unclassified Actinomyces]|uniref:succinate dehydrogenase/fumarate reductase iron-sulfur subunit n=1 Tax=unclassified Actinomyces TaxID=2609248 RepID=UPI0020180416|nr:MULTISPECIES: succinate dehydrogenase/fumarate reductase iron-sulfur subunit [unclassified Actinomyces]MCL3776902.1 succinate dehydrogenase/fumarate reductase iron-sulfur subunit [Actinomyces sp. AC-20-1]MCL3790319.1 succinate dehydrogenase/fumarate reductase iron-sulfur subunit [Actinomyces sp. 187325]MCL3792601.1 succinate dehydrogenase/fumarate reductase iron-sulfur subunit [Actinomyces sp. 186855]MCL3794210.1 succinate dehydrogenase/fumarate reductase iron-sulfur subunit [Actinomyces sp.